MKYNYILEIDLRKPVKIEVGRKYHHLRVLEQTSSNSSGDKRWECLCDCGNTAVVTSSNLHLERVKSCGCMAKELQKVGCTKHGKSYTNTYQSWKCMKARCLNPKSKYYSYYGGSGVVVCDRWLESFENFLEDMGECPQDTSLNRVKGSKVYSKETCEWATKSVQGFDQKKRSTNTSGRTGVCKTKSGSWLSQIRVNYKSIYLGTFKSYEKAVKAREDAEIKYFGFIKG